MKISASLVLYNTEENIVEESIASYLNSGVTGPLWVLDNSVNAKYSYLENSHRSINYIHTKENLGYGRAHNIALKHFLDISDYHLVLNPDISFADDVIEGLISFMQKDEKTALVAPSAEYPDGETQNNGRLIPDPLHLILRRFFFMGGRKNSFNKNYELNFNQSQAFLTPVVLGSFMLFKTSALKDVGLFDERFFLYPEDIDLSRRVFALYNNYILPQYRFTHYHQRESYKSMKLLLVHVKEMIKYFNKWSWFFDKEKKRLNQRVLETYDSGKV